jgi:GGDEF domain-containing protein
VFAAVFAIERLDLINARFGHEVGDQVLLFFGEHVAQALKGSDRLFRWTGPAFLALMERSEPAHKVREEISRVISRRLSKTVKIANRSVLLPVPTNWVVFDAQELRPLQRLVHSIDSFVHGGGAEPKASAVWAGLR